VAGTDVHGKIDRALLRRFKPPAWALLREVANATGGRARRRADAVAISCWPSRGLQVHGVEIKVSRSDWLRELTDPAKSEPVQRYCDRWWVVAPRGVVDLDELPSTWGLLLLQKGGNLRAEREAPPLDPVPADRAFLAALARSMHASVEAAEKRVLRGIQGDDVYDKGYQAGLEAGAARARLDLQRELNEGQRARQALEEFQSATGFSIDSWRARHVGGMMRAVLTAGSYRPMQQDYERLREALDRNLKIVIGMRRAAAEAERFLNASDEEWARRLHAGCAHPDYEYRLARSAPSEGWERNEEFERELFEHVRDQDDSWRRRMSR
jgi:hypothetical protein